MRLDDISISTKLILAFSVTLLSILLSGGVIYKKVKDRSVASEQAHILNTQKFDAMNAAAAHLDMAQTVRGYLLTGVERHRRLYEAAGTRFSEQIRKAIEPSELHDFSREALDSLSKMQTASRQWRTEIGDNILRLAANPATRDQALAIAMSERSSQFQQVFRDSQAEALAMLADMSRKIDQAESLGQQHTYYALVIGGIAALLSSIGAAILLSRNLGAPLVRLTAQIEDMARGNTSITFHGVQRKDAIGQIATACETFKANIIQRERLAEQSAQQRGEFEEARTSAEHERTAEMEKLRDSLSVFAGALGELARGNLLSQIDQPLYGPAESLRNEYNETVRQLRETIQAVAQTSRTVEAGSSELTSTADDMARRTEQQAANLEETAAALEQITETVKKTAEGAQQAREAIVSATADAEKGGSIVRLAIEAMSNIEKSSGQISQIIGVIDEIAFQTNLLALNAGVEAARAGDSGKGFAVVASEVRALAQRSAEAAKEIKSLISSSTGQVSQGVRLVAETGTALERIVAQVADIKDAVTAIASGASEQATGLQEINNAVGQMDQITQQNAAMVEESVASSHTLASEARMLTNYVGHFHTGATASPVASQVATPVRKPKPAARKPDMDASRTQEPVRRVANGGFAAAAGTTSRSDNWEEF